MANIGVTVTTSSQSAGATVPTNAGVAFITGLADKGPVGTAKLIPNLATFVSLYGPRVSGNSVLYDSVETFFREGGDLCYIARVSDGTASAASLTLNDGLGTPKPTVVVTASTVGLDGNNDYVVVTNDATTTFTGTTTSSSTTVSAVSSFTKIAAGVKVTGTGIPANTYIISVNTGASTLVLSNAASASNSGVVITPYTFTVKIQDSSANVLSTHGPYKTTSQLFADTTSALVGFTQSAGSGFTVNQPVTLSATALTGGLDASDLTSASYVSTANSAFGPDLGPGQILAPGQNDSTTWTGLIAHAVANNRYALLDVPDQTTAASVVAGAAALPTTAHADFSLVCSPSCTIPGVVPGTARTVPASAVAAGLCARVHKTGNDNRAPAGTNWPLLFVNGFSENTSPAGGWSLADVQTLFAGGINGFTVRYGTMCLYGFNTPVPTTSDAIFWSGAAARERMSLVANCQQVGEELLFDPIDGRGILLSKLDGLIRGVIGDHWKANALYGNTAATAGTVDLTGNTPASEQGGNLVATLYVRISPFAEAVQINVVSIPISQSVPVTA